MIYHDVKSDVTSVLFESSATSQLLTVERGSVKLFFNGVPTQADISRGISAAIGYQIIVPAGVNAYAISSGPAESLIITTAFGA